MKLDATFAAALRDVLVDQADGHSSSATRRVHLRRGRPWLGALLATIAGSGAIAYATGAFSTQPGADTVTALAAPVTATGTGTETVRLGPTPAGATSIAIDLTCLTAGRFTFADGANLQCDGASPSTTANYTLALKPGQDSTRITATPGARWRLVARYVKLTTTDWAVNASGQTYGVENKHGTPDLVAIIASNGRSGYAYARQLMWGPTGTPPASPAQAVAQNGHPYTVTVYESDGKTAIGTFTSDG